MNPTDAKALVERGIQRGLVSKPKPKPKKAKRTTWYQNEQWYRRFFAYANGK